MSTDKRHTLFKTFVVSPFNYCPLVLIFYTKELNNRIISLLEKALSLTYENRNSSFDKLLKLDKSVSRHYRNIQYLLTEIYKVNMGLVSPYQEEKLEQANLILRLLIQLKQFCYQMI